LEKHKTKYPELEQYVENVSPSDRSIQMLDDVKRCNSLIRTIRCSFKKRKYVRLSDIRETKLPRLLNLLRRAINTGNVLVTRLSQEVEERSATAAKVKNPRFSIGWKVPADQTLKVRRTLRSF